jgi:hypothetical protein
MSCLPIHHSPFTIRALPIAYCPLPLVAAERSHV